MSSYGKHYWELWLHGPNKWQDAVDSLSDLKWIGKTQKLKYMKEISSKENIHLLYEEKPHLWRCRADACQHTSTPFQSLETWISLPCSDAFLSHMLWWKERENWPMKKPRAQLLSVRRWTDASSHRSCMSMLRLCRKFPPNAKQSTGVRTAWIHPDSKQLRYKERINIINLNVVSQSQRISKQKVYFEMNPSASYYWQKQTSYLLGWRGCFLA